MLTFPQKIFVGLSEAALVAAVVGACGLGIGTVSLAVALVVF